MEKNNLKNLTKRTNNILFKIEQLIHVTKKGKKINFHFFVCLIFLMYMIKFFFF